MSWPLVAIGDVAEILSGNAWKSSQFTNESEGRLPIIRIQNISDVATDFIYWDGVALEKYIIKDGDLLLSLSGNVKLCEWSFGNALLNQRIVKLAPTACVDKRYFYWALHRVVAEIEAMARHAVIANVSVTDLKEFQIPLPPLPEQKRIAAILDKADAIRRKRQQAIQLADDFLRVVFLDMFGDPVTNPKGYPVTKLGTLCEDLFLGLTSKVDYIEGTDGYPLVRAKDINTGELSFDDVRYISEEQHKKLTKYHLTKKGDLLVSKSGTLGTCAIVRSDREFSTYESIFTVRPDASRLDIHYLIHLLQNKGFKEKLIGNKVGGTVAHLNLKMFRDFEIGVPPIELQKSFSNTILKCEAKLEKYRESGEEAEFLFSSASQKAFSGQL